MILFFLIAICLTLIGWYLIKPNDYWTRKNVPQRTPLPFFGNVIATIFRKKSFAEFTEDLYYMFPDWRYSGLYQMSIPTLILRDVELIKQICVRDFDHFTDRRSFVSEENEPLWGKNLLSLKGDKWKHMRATLSPFFTSSKMKTMYILMNECAENFVKHFDKQIGNDDVLEVDMRDVFSRFANDVIATTAFGIKCDSLGERDNQFYSMGKDVTTFSGLWKTMKFFIASFAPNFARLINARVLSKEASIFFADVVTETIRVREEKHIVRPDLINILMEARKGNKSIVEDTHTEDTGFAIVEEHIKPTNKIMEITDVDITAQALVFFFAGFDSVSSLITFTSYELAVNPDVQERLQKEIDETYDECNGKLTYEALLKMKYLDMVISETLRKWPNGVIFDRVCVKPYTIQPTRPDERPVHINVGDILWLPIYAIQRDEKYYPEPEKFDPERFNDDNKSNINPYSYLPFGIGPRNCIGSRFALLETKILYFHMLRKFTFVPVERTQIPLKLNRRALNVICEKGHWLGMKRRND